MKLTFFSTALWGIYNWMGMDGLMDDMESVKKLRKQNG